MDRQDIIDKISSLIGNVKTDDELLAGILQIFEQDCFREFSYRDIFNNIQRILWVHGLSNDEENFRFLEVNDYTLSHLLYSREEFLNLSPLDIISYVKHDIFDDMLNDIADKGEARYEMMFRKKGGDKIPLSITSYLIDFMGRKAVLSIGSVYPGLNEPGGKDIMMSKILEATDAAVIGMDTDNKIRYWNNGAVETFGYSEEEILGGDCSVIVEEEAREDFNNQIAKIMRGEKVLRTELFGITKSGEKKYISMTLSRFDDDMDYIRGLSIIARDISDRKQAEDELMKSREQVRNFAKHIEAAREKERKKIALEVHDGVGQALTALTLDLSWLKRSIGKQGEEVQEKLKMMDKLIDDTAGLVSRIASELRPSVLDHFGLVSAIEWQAEEFKKRTGIEVEFSADNEDIKIEEQRAIVALRIVQEILTNIIRHANASKVFIRIEQQDDILRLEIEDNGVGIKTEKIDAPGSFGLIGIYERVRAYEGSFNIGGAPGQGTIARIVLPMNDIRP